MTLEQLQLQHPDATDATWHQHKNGLGWVENTAHVDETAQVYGDARVYGNVWAFSPLYIQGSVHPISVADQKGIVYVGCCKMHIDQRLKQFAQVGEENEYSPLQIAEYGALLQAVKAWLVAYFPAHAEVQR